MSIERPPAELEMPDPLQRQQLHIAAETVQALALLRQGVQQNELALVGFENRRPAGDLDLVPVPVRILDLVAVPPRIDAI
jgi:hypothetical protein